MEKDWLDYLYDNADQNPALLAAANNLGLLLNEAGEVEEQGVDDPLSRVEDVIAQQGLDLLSYTAFVRRQKLAQLSKRNTE